MPRPEARAAMAIVSGVSMALAVAGCKPEHGDYGHIEVKSDFRVRGSDAFLYNDTLIAADSYGSLDFVATEPIGAGTIVLLRNGQKFRLCSVSIKKDRIVSVSLNNNQGLIRCDVAP